MHYNTSYTKIVTDENLMETIQHGSKDYPFCFYYDNLSLFDFNCIDWHWHSELEFVLVEKGTVNCSVGEDQSFCRKETPYLSIQRCSTAINAEARELSRILYACPQ